MKHGAIHLDSNFLIGALVAESREDEQLRVWVKENRPISMSSVAWTEFLCGPLHEKELSLSISIISDPRPFTAEMGKLAAQLFNETGRRRGSLADCMIAATSIVEHARLATLNRRDFNSFETFGLVLV